MLSVVGFSTLIVLFGVTNKIVALYIPKDADRPVWKPFATVGDVSLVWVWFVSDDDSCSIVVSTIATVDDGSEVWFSCVSVDDISSLDESIDATVENDSPVLFSFVSVDDSCSIVVSAVATVDEGCEVWFFCVSVDDSCSLGVTLVASVDDDSVAWFSFVSLDACCLLFGTVDSDPVKMFFCVPVNCIIVLITPAADIVDDGLLVPLVGFSVVDPWGWSLEVTFCVNDVEGGLDAAFDAASVWVVGFVVTIKLVLSTELGELPEELRFTVDDSVMVVIMVVTGVEGCRFCVVELAVVPVLVALLGFASFIKKERENDCVFTYTDAIAFVYTVYNRQPYPSLSLIVV